jgi:hypothetical protein
MPLYPYLPDQTSDPDSLNKLYDDLNKFNQEYLTYVEAGCTKDSLTDIQKVLCNNYHNSNGNGTLDNQYTLISREFTNTTEVPTVKSIKSTHDDLLVKRNALDQQIKELYNTQDSIGNLYKRRYDSTIYTGILLSALAASLLYYVFKEL